MEAPAAAPAPSRPAPAPVEAEAATVLMAPPMAPPVQRAAAPDPRPSDPPRPLMERPPMAAPPVRPPAGPPPLARPAPPSSTAGASPIAPTPPQPTRRGGARIILLSAILFLGVGLGSLLLRSSGSGDDESGGIFVSLDASAKGADFKVITADGGVIFSHHSEKDSKDDWTPQNSGDPTEITWGVHLANRKDSMLIDRWGKKTVNPPGIPFDDWHEGLAAAHTKTTGSLCGYLDRRHQMVVPAEYASCGPFSDGLALVGRDGRFGYVNRSGKLQIPLRFSGGCEFSDGLAKVTDSGEDVYIDTTGKTALPANYNGCTKFGSGRAAAADKSLWGFRDRSGNWAIPAKYRRIVEFRSGMAWGTGEDGVTKLIDPQGKETPLPEVSEGRVFVKGLAVARGRSGWGLINTSGRFVAEPKYSEIGPLVNGLRSALLNDSGGRNFLYLDEHGSVVNPPAPLCPSYRSGVFVCANIPGGQNNALAMLQMLTQGMQSIDYLTRSGSRIGGIHVDLKGL